MKVAIIGAGPSALVTAKTLLEASDAHPDFHPVITIFEAEDDIGGTFRYRSYSNATLVSSKQLTSFSDFRLPLDHKDHLTLAEYVRYLDDYTTHFKLRSRCHFRMNTKVIKSVRVDGGHLVRYRSLDAPADGGADRSEVFSHLCVCSGLHVTPALPNIPGLPPTIQGDQVVTNPMGSDETVASRIPEPIKHATAASDIITLHSSQFKDRSLYRGKRVMVLGTGETGMDMAYEAVKAGAKEVVLCTRSGFLLFPAVLADFVVLGNVFDGNLPIDGLITNLFETAYVHPWVAASHLRWFISDFVIKRLLWVLTGTQAGCNQWVGELEPHRLGRAYTFLNKSSKAMPYINRGWKRRSPLLERVTRYLDPPTVKPDEVSVDLAPFPARVNEDGTVEFVRNGRKEELRMRNRTVKPDIVVYATGYTQNFDFLSKEYPVPATVRCRDVFDADDPSVAFIGFVRPGVGAIPPIAEMQAQLWTLVLRGQIPPPLSTPHYYLLVKENARIKYGVDYSSYVSTLARDMGTAPPLAQLWWTYGLKVTLIYCFGAAFPTFYRLLGPYQHPDAKRIVETEIYDTIKRRGVVGNLMMGLIPMLFYAWINLVALVVETGWKLVSALTPGLSRRGEKWTGRRFQSDFRQDTTPPAVATRGKNAGNKRGRMLRLFALFAGMLAVVQGVEGNTEIRNLGPVRCRADEYGHLAAKAADQLSASWPVLHARAQPSLFGLDLGTLGTASSAGAWVVLDLSSGGQFTLPAPREARLYAELGPRGRYVRETIDSVAWWFTRRFTVRAVVAAHLAVDLELHVMGPEEALQLGGVEWKAELVETAPVPTDGVTQQAKANAGKEEEGEGERVTFKDVHTQVAGEILAADTIAMTHDAPPMFPCTKLFVHIVPHPAGVAMPPSRDYNSTLLRVAEAVFGGLQSTSNGVDTAPIHLTFERLYLGFIPATALQLFLPLLIMLPLGRFLLIPTLHTLLPTPTAPSKTS
ncbi:related to flavin-containing monooxygenase [Moesziomyces antarcticus]|nr:related to flavin-containing monooxygenase [Moesziomyces antarcticus]